MKVVAIPFIFILIMTNCICAQKGFPKYYEFIALTTKADSLSKINNHPQAARLYFASINAQIERGFSIPRDGFCYKAARSWALAGMPDSAIHCLDILVYKMNYKEYDKLLAEECFKSLHKKLQWNDLLEKTKLNRTNAETFKENYRERTTVDKNSKVITFYPLTEYAKQFIVNDTFPFVSINYSNFRIYFRGNSIAAKQIDSVQTRLSDALKKNLMILKSTGYQQGINIILVDSAGEMKNLTGLYIRGGLAFPGTGLIFFVYDGIRKAQFKHELFHLLSNDLWGATYSRILNEGGAVYADNECIYDNPCYSINSYMKKNGKIVPIQTLIKDFNNLAKDNEVATYFQSAGIFKYLYEKYGTEKMKQLWQGGFDKFSTIYSKTLEQFEIEWLEFISTINLPINMNWETLIEDGCN